MEDPILREIRDYFRKELVAEDLADDTPLIDSGLVDSMFVLRLISHLEKRYAITIPDELVAPDSFQDINAIVRLARKLLGRD